MLEVEKKWNTLSETDQFFVEQIIDQLLTLKDVSISEADYAMNMDRLKKMKDLPKENSTDVIAAIRTIRSKLGNEG